MSDTVTKSKNVTESRECDDAVTASPLPWRLEPMFNGVADARGEKVAANIRAADAALIADAVNEREAIIRDNTILSSAFLRADSERHALRFIVREMAGWMDFMALALFEEGGERRRMEVDKARTLIKQANDAIVEAERLDERERGETEGWQK